MNPREFEILNLLCSKDAATNPVPKPVELVRALADDSEAPAMTDFMAVAAETASDETVAAVTAFCEAHPEYVEMLGQFKRFAGNDEMPEPAIKGSILERMKVSDFNRIKAEPNPNPHGVKNSDGWSHAIAASTGSGAELGSLDATGETRQDNQSEDWWVLRRTSDGNMLYVGNPNRVKSGEGWGAVVVELPRGRRKGMVAYSSADLVVVNLEPCDDTTLEGQ